MRGDFIYKELIKKYIPKLTTDDIKNYAKSKNISLTDSETLIIYNFIKTNYMEILNGNEEKLLSLKKTLREDLYNIIINLYKENKNKYLS